MSVYWYKTWFQIEQTSTTQLLSIGRTEGTALRILNLTTRWRLVVSFTRRAALPRERSPRYTLNRIFFGGYTDELTFSRLVPRLIMRGVIPPVPQQLFMTWFLIKHVVVLV